jgi:L-iditol 2-dehydrogenase
VRVARLHGVGDLRVTQEPVPSADGPDVLVRVTAVGICGSDLHWWDEGAIGDAKLTHPLVLGHEGAGVIADGPRGGERVAIDPAIPCERCRACRDGYRNLCYRLRFSGHEKTDGMMREFMTWPAAQLYPLPDRLSDVDGAMLEPLGVAVHSIDLGHLPFCGSASVVGCGPIGLLLIQLLKAAGASSVLAIEPLAHRREAAARLGADLVADPGSLGDGLMRELTGHGVDVAFEAAGNDESVGLAIDSVRPGGRVVLAGIPGDDTITLQASAARRKGLTIAMVRRMNEVYPRAISLAERGVVDLASVVTSRMGLGEIQAAFGEGARRSGLKVVIEPQRLDVRDEAHACGAAGGCARLLLRAVVRDHRAGQPCEGREPGRHRHDGVAVPGRTGWGLAGGPGLASAVRAFPRGRGRVARSGRRWHGAPGGVRAGHRGRVYRGRARVPRPVPARLAAGDSVPPAVTGVAAGQ